MGMLNIQCITQDTTNDTLIEANECDFVYISENVSSGDVGAAYLHYQKPIVINENGLLDEMSWKTAGFASQGSKTVVDAAGIDHRILDLAGISGVLGDPVTIYSSGTNVVSWPLTNFPTGTEHLLLYDANNANSVLSVIPAGTKRHDASYQIGVGIWLGPYSNSVNFTNEGRLLFRSVFQYVAEEITKNDIDYYPIPVPAVGGGLSVPVAYRHYQTQRMNN